MGAVLRIISGLAVASSIGFASAAHALTVVPFSTGPFSVSGNSAGVIPAGTFLNGTMTEDFSFTITGPARALAQMQASTVVGGTPQTISFQLFKGAPGSGSWLANSGGTADAATLEKRLLGGSYYAQVTTFSAPMQLVTGGLKLSVPEPGAWAMLLIGFAGLGAVARRRRLSAAG
jgi:hypothetical protein